MTEQNQRDTGVADAKYLGVGITLVGSTGLFLYLGSLLDAHWGSKPALTVVGAFVGAGLGFYNLYRLLATDTRRAAHERETGRKQ